MELKRQKRRAEALIILLECIDAAERQEHRVFPAPWYTWQAAVIFRQEGEHSAEVAILERWMRALPDGYDYARWGASARSMFPRLERARDILRQKQANTEGTKQKLKH